jgi:hypothetical protein
LLNIVYLHLGVRTTSFPWLIIKREYSLMVKTESFNL